MPKNQVLVYCLWHVEIWDMRCMFQVFAMLWFLFVGLQISALHAVDHLSPSVESRFWLGLWISSFCQLNHVKIIFNCWIMRPVFSLWKYNLSARIILNPAKICLVKVIFFHTLHPFSTHFTDMEVSWNRGTPSHHPFLVGIFHYKSSIPKCSHLWKPPYRAEDVDQAPQGALCAACHAVAQETDRFSQPWGARTINSWGDVEKKHRN